MFVRLALLSEKNAIKTLKLDLHIHIFLECFTIFSTEGKLKCNLILRKRDELILREFKAPLEKESFEKIFTLKNQTSI